MSLDSYTNLKTEIEDWLEDGTITAKLDTFIDLCETRLQRVLNTIDMEGVATATVADGEYLALPDGFAGVRTMRAVTPSGAEYPVRYITDAQMSEFPIPATNYRSRFVTVVDGQFRFYPPLDDADIETIEITYTKRFTPLSASNATNWLLADHPDAYLAGSLVAAFEYKRDRESVAVWSNKWDQATAEIIEYDVRKRFTGPMLQMRPYRVAGDIG